MKQLLNVNLTHLCTKLQKSKPHSKVYKCLKISGKKMLESEIARNTFSVLVVRKKLSHENVKYNVILT